MHGEQRSDAVEPCAVANGCRHRYHGTCRQSADHTGERTFHPGDHDHRLSRSDPVDVGEQTMQPGHPHVVESVGNDAVRPQRERSLICDGHVSGASRHDKHSWLWLTNIRCSIQHASGGHLGGEALIVHSPHCLHLGLARPREQHGTGAVVEQLTDDRHALLGALSGPVHSLGHALSKRPMMIDERIAHFGEREPPQPCHRIVRGHLTGANRVDESSEFDGVHRHIVARPRAHRPSLARVNASNTEPAPNSDTLRVAFFGPFGTFTEQALRTQSDLASGELLPMRTVPDVLDAVTSGEVDLGFVPIENSIEGMVNFTLDALAFDHDLVITREVVLDIHLCLAAPAGTAIADIADVMSIPVATAQCHRFLREHLPNAAIRAATSTAGAAKSVSEDDSPGLAAIAPRVAAELYGLEVLASDIEDESGNQTRFVVVSRDGARSATGHDRTGLVVFQRADEPGSLISILQEFAARRINLSNLISRPIKHGGLGEYCFIILAEGHVDDDLMADTMRSLHAKQASVKWFGSWPRADGAAQDVRATADERWRQADDWISAIRRRIG